MMISEKLLSQLREPWKPRDYQERLVNAMVDRAYMGACLWPGMGKTSATLAVIDKLKKQGEINKVLIIAPVRVCHNVWPDEIVKWRDFGHLKCVVLHGPKKDKALEQDVDIYLINPEGLEWLLTERGAYGVKTFTDAKLKALGVDCLVIDELTKFKHPDTKRFKLMRKVLPLFRRRYGLTGSLLSNGLMDLFGQCYMLDQGLALGRFITHYRNEFFVQSFNGYSWDPRPNADEQIRARIAPFMFHVPEDKYADLPELVENNIFVTLPKDVMKVYKALESQFITQIKGHTVTAANAAAAATKCRQLANGGVYVNEKLSDGDHAKAILALRHGDLSVLKDLAGDSKRWAHVHMEKLAALAEIVEELQGSPLLVAYDFLHDLDRARDTFGRDVAYIGSGVSDSKTAKIIEAWNAGEIPILFGHPQSIGHGLNLQGSGCHVAWLSLTWNFELYDQFIRRVYRQGNKHARVFVHHIIAKGTVDEAVMRALKVKDRGQRALLSELENLHS